MPTRRPIPSAPRSRRPAPTPRSAAWRRSRRGRTWCWTPTAIPPRPCASRSPPCSGCTAGTRRARRRAGGRPVWQRGQGPDRRLPRPRVRRPRAGGGPNAGHRVYEEGVPYTFHLLPSGTRVAPRTRVVLGPGATLDLTVLQQEIADCRLEPGRLFIDPQALLIEPEDVAFEEASLRQQIASTARGVGAAAARKVLRTAARLPVRFARDIPELGPTCVPRGRCWRTPTRGEAGCSSREPRGRA
ncbi:adenylosuccinate synthetase [Archangium primigenium]|uniref:adenylosuccinate synthetase n=1 Tax=[Archangium] primigenium TaxID=2792470 RepID=UPI0030845681